VLSASLILQTRETDSAKKGKDLLSVSLRADMRVERNLGMGERNLTHRGFVLLHALIARPSSLYDEDVAVDLTDVHSLLC
jgi:hypothetical protein